MQDQSTLGEFSKNKKIRLFYLGSGEIGLPVLSILAASSDIEFTGCGTQPDRKQGRNRKLTPTPVALWCNTNGVRVEKPHTVNDPKFLKQLQALDLDIIVVFSFGQILREPLLNLPRSGCLNIHTSLLPKHRGASPISATILAGDTQTGVTFMKMEKGLDTGPIYKAFKVPISNKISSLELEDILAQLAAAKACEMIVNIVNKKMKPTQQNREKISYSTRVKKEDGLISWNTEAYI